MEAHMFPRIRIALAVSAALFVLTALPAFAKGGFDFLTITGPDLEQAVRIDDTRLTEDFFTFANFSEDRTKAPADPGKSYEITRHYLQGMGSVIFDRLHYYPETGFVYYDGIENGESEYDGEWYRANADIRAVFESVLAAQIAGLKAENQPVNEASGLSPARPSLFQSPILPLIALMATLTIFFVLAVRSRRSALR
jgi:hypothetical protein